MRTTSQSTNIMFLLSFFCILFLALDAVAVAFNDTGNGWKTRGGPYGGDRKDIVIDYHNPEIVFVSSSDLSGVWVSTTGGEKKSPYDFAWHHTKLQTHNTRIAGTFDDDNSYIFACKLDEADSAGHIYRLSYARQQTAIEELEWEKIVFASATAYRAQHVYTNRYLKERVIVVAKNEYRGALNKSIDISRMYISNDYGNPDTWQYVDFGTHPFPGNSLGHFLAKDVIFDPHESEDVGSKATWRVVTDGLDGINVFGVASSKGLIYGVVQSAIAWKRIDDSSDWTMRQITDPDGEVTANLYGGVEIDPYNPENILVGAGYDKPQLSHLLQ